MLGFLIRDIVERVILDVADSSDVEAEAEVVGSRLFQRKWKRKGSF